DLPPDARVLAVALGRVDAGGRQAVLRKGVTGSTARRCRCPGGAHGGRGSRRSRASARAGAAARGRAAQTARSAGSSAPGARGSALRGPALAGTGSSRPARAHHAAARGGGAAVGAGHGGGSAARARARVGVAARTEAALDEGRSAIERLFTSRQQRRDDQAGRHGREGGRGTQGTPSSHGFLSRSEVILLRLFARGRAHLGRIRILVHHHRTITVSAYLPNARSEPHARTAARTSASSAMDSVFTGASSRARRA